MQTRSKSGIFKLKNILSLTTLHTDSDPSYFSKAVKHSHWRQAMVEEFNTFLANHTWDLIPQIPTMHVVGCKWIYKTKFKSDGSIECYKARLVAL